MVGPILASRRDAAGNATALYDVQSQETTMRYNAIVLDEDFIGAGHTAGIPLAGAPVAGYPWVKKIVGAAPPTVAPVANAAYGVVACALTSTAEKEEATLYCNDNLTFNEVTGCSFETYLAVQTLPTLLTEMVWGLQSAWVDGPDNAAFYMEFQIVAGGALNIRTKDGVNTLSASTGITLVAGAFHTFRIDGTDPTNIVFQMDGTTLQTVTGQFTFAATGANAVLQPYISAYKASGAGLGTIYVDTVQVSNNRH
jgi:hypothetical protein